MTKFSILILGSASAAPTLARNPSAQLININEQYYLVDCGEGTQNRLRQHKIKFQRLNHIFISHLHGDHYLGLLGLLQTMSLLGRTLPLNLYGPKQLKELVDMNLAYSHSTLKYPLIFHETQTNQSEVLFENEHLTISTIILDHRVPCTGFLFKEKPKPRKINPKAIKRYEIPKYAMDNLKRGLDFSFPDKNEVIKNELLTLNPDESYSYAYCSDTKFNERIVPQLKDIDILYHEATFLHRDEKRAEATYHSTAKQAATIAKQANAKLLIIGHFSNRYKDLNVLLDEAKTIFANTQLAQDDAVFEMV
ncbi:MAG: ribonuclease Z [Flavobacteriales bacterium]|nr:ribonuclease Z [Flavobacteriales bacterium]